jgi:hypothetical protein
LYTSTIKHSPLSTSWMHKRSMCSTRILPTMTILCQIIAASSTRTFRRSTSSTFTAFASWSRCQSVKSHTALRPNAFRLHSTSAVVDNEEEVVKVPSKFKPYPFEVRAMKSVASRSLTDLSITSYQFFINISRLYISQISITPS